MHDLSHAESLIEIAEIDFTALRGMSDERFLASRVVGFHAQQAIEKLLKCWLVILRIEYPLTHSIGQLLQLIRNQDTEASQFEDLQEFTPYAVLFAMKRPQQELQTLIEIRLLLGLMISCTSSGKGSMQREE